MPIFPKIQSPCPYKSEVAAALDGEMCRICQRQVFDLTAMTDGERVAFLAGCEDDVCVSYRIPRRPAIAAAALAAAAMSVPAYAQPAPAPAEVEMEVPIDSAAYPDEDWQGDIGGIKDPKAVEMVEIDTSLPELPIVYEDEPAGAKAGPVPGVTGPAGA